MESELCHRCYWGYNVAHPLMLDKFQSLRNPTNALHIQNARSPNEKGRRFFSWRPTTCFSASFQKAYKSIWTRSSKATCCIKGARKSLWKEQTYKTAQLVHIIRVLRKKKNNTDLYTCFKHLPKCKAVVNQVTAMCMLISILLCYRRVQEESWKAFNVLFSIPSQRVIIAKPSLPFFFQ